MSSATGKATKFVAKSDPSDIDLAREARSPSKRHNTTRRAKSARNLHLARGAKPF
jgi:hypothetical protein